MNYLRLADNAFGITESEIRAAHPNTSYPRPMPAEVPGYVGVQDVARPDFDPITQNAVEVQPVQVDGVWTQQWEVSALSDDIVATHIAAAYAASIPPSVTRRQAKTLMELTPHPEHGDLWQAALAAASAISDPTTRIVTVNYLKESLNFERPQVLVMASQLLGMTEAQVDQLFIAAATL